MSLTVVDASALAAVVFNEPAAARVHQQLHDTLLVAPRLLAYELTNTAWRKIRQHPDQAAALAQALARALSSDFAITWADVEFEEVLPLALEKGLTAYDASYLWLARHINAVLVTLDETLSAAT